MQAAAACSALALTAAAGHADKFYGSANALRALVHVGKFSRSANALQALLEGVGVHLERAEHKAEWSRAL